MVTFMCTSPYANRLIEKLQRNFSLDVARAASRKGSKNNVQSLWSTLIITYIYFPFDGTECCKVFDGLSYYLGYSSFWQSRSLAFPH